MPIGDPIPPGPPKPGQPPPPGPTPAVSDPLPDSEIHLIYNGLMIPNERSIQRMAYELGLGFAEGMDVKNLAYQIKVKRGDPNPRAI
jgi:hypothetical protein